MAATKRKAASSGSKRTTKSAAEVDDQDPQGLLGVATEESGEFARAGPMGPARFVGCGAFTAPAGSRNRTGRRWVQRRPVLLSSVRGPLN